MGSVENKKQDKTGKQELNSDLFYTIACLYSEGQLSLEIATRSSGLTKEEFLEKYENFKRGIWKL